VPDAYLEKIFHINLISHWYTVREFLPGMISGKKGHIVTTASMASYTAVAGMVDYCCTKAGTMAFHEGLTQELKHRYNAPYIKTTAVHPYWVQTALITGWVEAGLKKVKNPLLTPEYVGGEMAKAILSGKSGHMTLPRSNPTFALATGARGWPHWALALVNDTTKNDTAVINA
jgi:all-trans-retinol dehydrogenase (NAD+)